MIRGDFYKGNMEGKYDKLIRGDFWHDGSRTSHTHQ